MTEPATSDSHGTPAHGSPADGHADAHADAHDDGHSDDEPRLGPIDWRAWLYAVVGFGAGLLVVGVLWFKAG